MELGQWLTLVTYAGLLALGVSAILRMRTSPLAGPLAALCLISFTWNFAVWAQSVSRFWTWTYVDRTASPWTAPAGLYFVLTFIGQRRRLRRLLQATNVLFGSLSLVAASGFVSDWGRQAAVSALWDNTLAGLILLYFVPASWFLWRHLRRAPSAEEAMRTRLVIASVVVGSVISIVELVLHTHLIVPPMLVVVVLLTVVAFGFKLFESKLAGLAAVYASALALIASGGYVIAFHLFAPDLGVTALVIFAITWCWLALFAQIARAVIHHRARVEKLTTLGRFASQMAHDLKNPLAALKGAAQYLAEERAQGRSIDDQRQFLELLVSESERLSRLIDRYQRLGRLESARVKVGVNELVRRTLDMHRLACKEHVAAHLELADELPECSLDPDLVTTALENLLRNATEAMSSGGTLTVRTERVLSANESNGESVAITVEDSGAGMHPREIEQAFDEFFSTKAMGSGLGLPLVKRVVDSHGGSVSIRSQIGRGTRVVLLFPIT